MTGFLDAPVIESDGYQVQRSLRLRGSANAYISRTYGTSTNRNTSSVAVCVKRGALGTTQTIFAAGTDDSNKTLIRFNSADQIEFSSVYDSSGQGNLTTTAVFREPTAWLCLLFVFDFSNATASERVRIFSEDTRLAVSTVVGVSGSNNHWINTGATEHRFARSFGTVQQGDMYDAAIHWVDGQALTPASFGERHFSGNWRPKAYSGTYGSQGSQLDFSDPTSLTTLMADRSGNGNNWTASNISLTAGATYDSMIDVPLGGGGNERGNYCTLNPITPAPSTVGTISNGNLTETFGVSSVSGTQTSTFALGAGKQYYEASVSGVSVGDATNNNIGFGFRSLSAPNTRLEYGWVSDGAIMRHSLRYILAGVQQSRINVDTTIPAGSDTLALAFDIDNGVITAYKNGTQTAQITGVSSSVSDWSPHLIRDGTDNGATWNLTFGQRPFAYTPPAGFKALHTGNLTSDTVITSGSFTGNVSADGPFVWMNGAPEALTINGNAVTWGTHADKTAGGFKLRTSSSSYNASGTNTWTATVLTPASKSAFRRQLAKINP